MRTAENIRKTSETLVKVSLNIDGEGKSDIKTGSGFLDHMLTLFARHGGFDLAVSEEGVSFTFHRCIPYSSVLYAGNGAGDMLACLRIALSLRGWEKA